MTNLGSNAVKFTASGEVFRSARPPTRPTATATLRVEVVRHRHRDRADAVPTALRQPSPRPTRPRPGVHGGTGLGLAISREIVHALGGEIGVRQRGRAGQRLLVHRRLRRTRWPPRAPTTSTRRTWLAGRRVLVVDDTERQPADARRAARLVAGPLERRRRRGRGRAGPRGRDRRGRPVRRGADRPHAVDPPPRRARSWPAPCAASRRTTTYRCC